MPYPYPYQSTDVAAITGHGPQRWLIAHDTGVGKTVIALLALKKMKQARRYNLIVVPKSLRLKWQDEWDVWGDGTETVIVGGSKANRLALLNKYRDSGKIIITNYATVRIEAKWFKDNPPNIIIVDEAQHIKQSAMSGKMSQVAKAITQINANHRYLLSATPMDYKPYELWTILSYLMPDRATSFDRFFARYCLYEVRTAWNSPSMRQPTSYRGYNGPRPETQEELRTLLKEVMIRRAKRDVLTSLPPLLIEMVRLEATPQQYKLYESFTKFDGAFDDKGRLLSTDHTIGKVTRLRQVMINPAIIKKDGEQRDFPDVSHKFDYILGEIESQQRPIVIFSSYVTALDLLATKLASTKHSDGSQVRVVRITGKESTEERRIAYTKINRGEADVALCSYGAGGEGIDLYGADRIIALDLPWSYIQWYQAYSRIERNGQRNPMLVSVLVTPATIEDYVWALIRNKQDVTNELIVRHIIERGNHGKK